MRKRILSFCLATILLFAMVVGLTPAGFASNAYYINGKYVHWDDFSSSPDECWAYANNVYNKIWGQRFSNSFSDSNNSLRELNDGELTLTLEHLKAYVSNAVLGSCLRICNSEYLHGSDGWGHSQIIVQKDSNGFTVFEGGLTSSPYCREKYYTWSEYINTGWLGGTYAYIKYIKWPGAPAYNSQLAGDMLDLGDDFYAHIILEEPWLHIEASKDGDVRIAKDGNNSKDGKQIWHFVKSSDGSYEIGNEYADLRLDAKNWGTENGTHVGVGADNDTTAQRWFILKSGTSCKIAASYKPSMVLCPAGNRNDAGNPIQLYSDNNSASQRFSIYKIDTDGIKYEKPSRPGASSIVSVATTGNNTVITWEKSELMSRFDCREYDLRIWQGGADNIDWGNPYFIEYGISGTSTYVQLPAGGYTCCITAVNSYYDSWYAIGSYYEFLINSTCTEHDYYYSVSQTPTFSATGSLVGICSRCEARTSVLIPELTTTDYTYDVVRTPSCTATGIGRYTWKTTTYGIFWFEVTLDKTSHS